LNIRLGGELRKKGWYEKENELDGKRKERLKRGQLGDSGTKKGDDSQLLRKAAGAVGQGGRKNGGCSTAPRRKLEKKKGGTKRFQSDSCKQKAPPRVYLGGETKKVFGQRADHGCGGEAAKVGIRGGEKRRGDKNHSQGKRKTSRRKEG